MLAAVAPLLDVSRVCVRWHTIVMSTPELWTDIWVSNVHSRGSHNLPIAKGLLQSALQRSRDLPLRIHVRNYARYNADRNKSVPTACNALMSIYWGVLDRSTWMIYVLSKLGG